MSDPGRLAALRRAADHASAFAPSVSRWSVGMHVHHAGLSTIEILRALASSQSPPEGGVSLIGRLVLALGRIPRGRGEAPEIVRPTQLVSVEELARVLDEAEEQYSGAHSLPPRSWMPHPYFGALHRDRALRFVEVHNAHHLRIISDILAAGRR